MTKEVCCKERLQPCVVHKINNWDIGLLLPCSYFFPAFSWISDYSLYQESFPKGLLKCSSSSGKQQRGSMRAVSANPNCFVLQKAGMGFPDSKVLSLALLFLGSWGRESMGLRMEGEGSKPLPCPLSPRPSLCSSDITPSFSDLICALWMQVKRRISVLPVITAVTRTVGAIWS